MAQKEETLGRYEGLLRQAREQQEAELKKRKEEILALQVENPPRLINTFVQLINAKNHVKK